MLSRIARVSARSRADPSAEPPKLYRPTIPHIPICLTVPRIRRQYACVEVEVFALHAIRRSNRVRAVPRDRARRTLDWQPGRHAALPPDRAAPLLVARPWDQKASLALVEHGRYAADAGRQYRQRRRHRLEHDQRQALGIRTTKIERIQCVQYGLAHVAPRAEQMDVVGDAERTREPRLSWVIAVHRRRSPAGSRARAAAPPRGSAARGSSPPRSGRPCRSPRRRDRCRARAAPGPGPPRPDGTDRARYHWVSPAAGARRPRCACGRTRRSPAIPPRTHRRSAPRGCRRAAACRPWGYCRAW